ncbi:hypothetical protein HII31_08895 [Pseudocercospora fuligena]|uniref:Uncharacterized protein n=1 Tax=Pseudocercospora fuligena TaxID=685502 RepID=A0A8H6RF33_9PEZI|nr:hypothetical protein HII31_08895 [Pseudocercospora fuligena]
MRMYRRCAVSTSHNPFLFAGRERLDAVTSLRSFVSSSYRDPQGARLTPIAASPEARCGTACALYLQYLDNIPELAFDTPCAHNRPPTNIATRGKPQFPFVLCAPHPLIPGPLYDSAFQMPYKVSVVSRHLLTFRSDSVSMITREDSTIFIMGRGAYDTTG